MTIAKWLVISLIYSMCLQNTDNHPFSTKHKNTTVKNKTQSLKQKDLRTEATVESKSIDRRQEKNIATTETKSTNYESSNSETTEKSKTVILVKLESKRRQLGTESQPKPHTEKKGYMPICGIDSYEDEIFGCIELEATKVDTITPAATTTQEVKYDRIAYRQGGADGSSTDIIWVDGAPDVQKLPEEMDLCKGLAKCRLPFGSSNSSTV